MHIILLFLVIWQVPVIGWSEVTTAEPEQSDPARPLGRMALTPWAGMAWDPQCKRSPAFDLCSGSLRFLWA